MHLCSSPDSFNGCGVELHPQTQKLNRHQRRRLEMECLARQKENINGRTGLRNLNAYLQIYYDYKLLSVYS